jgi:DNA polymerase III alpha subunit
MRTDKYSNPIFNEQDLFDALYQGHQFSVDDTMLVEERTNSIKQIELQLGFKFMEPYETHFEIADYDRSCQRIWNMPEDYCPNLVEMLYGMCTTEEQTTRVSEELEAFIQHGMMDLLFYLKYLVDTLRANNVVWGVGRGSSVASYVLYLIGVHRIDSMKYNLDWHEFLR